MAVITTDVLVEGIRRVDVLEWLSDPEHHARMLAGAFDDVVRTDDTTWALTLDVTPKKRVIGYVFDQMDESHGGRRVLCHTTGKRTSGKLNYSLRTMRPSTNTLITLHTDYDPGGPLGQLYDVLVMREALEQRWRRVLENLNTEIVKDLG
ncbi:MAG: hypothetical protein H6739_02385 [Alphaproteobacteria bacterium]|nr:hypothetical protein [Alphaproteobacteria bacterium]